MKGLSFSEPMVKAWMEGRKTVTRWFICGIEPSFFIRERRSAENFYLFTKMAADEENQDGTVGVYIDKWIKPPYLPGETVYIKETWAVAAWRVGQVDLYYADEKKPITRSAPAQFITSLDADEHKWHPGKSNKYDPFRIRSPRFMPEWASRSHALIASVRPERVREITEEEAIREGVTPSIVGDDLDYLRYRAGFQTLWNTLSPGSWERNDWVWRINLERI